MPNGDKYSVAEFATIVRNKYNAYQDIADDVLVEKYLEKYPVYQDRIDFNYKQPETQVEEEAIEEPTQEEVVVEEAEPVVEKKKEGWQPKYAPDYYEGLSLMNKDRANYETWKQNQKEAELDQQVTPIAKPSISVPETNVVKDFETDLKVKEKQAELKSQAERDLVVLNNAAPPKTEKDFYENIYEVQNNLIQSNPEIAKQIEKTNSDLEAEFNKGLNDIKIKHGIDSESIKLELSKKYDLSDAKQVELANKEFERVQKERINSPEAQADLKSLQDEFNKYAVNAHKNLAKSPLYNQVSKEAQKVVSEIGDPMIRQFSRDKFKDLSFFSDFGEGGFTGLVFETSDYLQNVAKGTVFENTPVGWATGLTGAAAEGFGSGVLMTEKSFDATKVSLKQLGVQNIEGEIIESQNTALPIQDDQKIKVFANGTIDYEGSGIERPASAGEAQSALDVWYEGKNTPKYNWKGQLVTGPQSLKGGKMATTEMTYSEWKKQKRKQQEVFKKDIEGDIENILKTEELSALFEQADFFDEDGATMKDVIMTVAQMSPQLSASVAGSGLAGITGGSSLIASTMFMWGTEYGNNYWDGLTTGLSEELGRPPTNEEIVGALLEDKYQGQAEAAGWAAVSSLLEQGTGMRTSGQLNKTFKEFAKKAGYKDLKDMMVKTGKNQFKDMLRDGGKTLIETGKSGVTEFFTEGLQSLTNQAAVSQTLGGNAVERFNFEEALQEATAGGVVGIFLPGVRGMYRGGKTVIREASYQAAIGLNMNSAEGLKQFNTFFKDAAFTLEKQHKDGKITKEEYQQQSEELANMRNSGLKITKNFSPEARQKTLELMLERDKLNSELKKVDEAFQPEMKEKVKELNEKIVEVQKQFVSTVATERITQKAIKASKKAGLGDMFVGRTKEDVDTKLNELVEKGEISKKDALEAKGSDGFVVPGTGEIIINIPVAEKMGGFNVASHELLHKVLYKTISKDPKVAETLSNSLKEYLNSIDVTTIENEYLKGRLELYKDKSQEMQAEEMLTIFSDALALGAIKVKENVLAIRRIMQFRGYKEIKFKDGKDVLNFIKDYNKSIKKGKFTGSQVKLAKKGVDVVVAKEAATKETKTKETKTKKPKGEKLTALEKMEAATKAAEEGDVIVEEDKVEDIKITRTTIKDGVKDAKGRTIKITGKTGGYKLKRINEKGDVEVLGEFNTLDAAKSKVAELIGVKEPTKKPAAKKPEAKKPKAKKAPREVTEFVADKPEPLKPADVKETNGC
jgi:hypothetical protein